MIGDCAILLTACRSRAQSLAESGQSPGKSLTRVIGREVRCRERAELPPGAERVVMLDDRSRADAPTTVMAAARSKKCRRSSRP